MRATGASGRIYGSRPQAAPRGLGAVSLAQALRVAFTLSASALSCAP